jgi:hypothetical protein
MTIFSVQNLTIVSAAGGGSQVQVPTYNQNLTADQTRQLANAVAFSLATRAQLALADGIYIIPNAPGAIMAPLGTAFLQPGVMVAVTLPSQALSAQFLTLAQAQQLTNALSLYSVTNQ